MSNIEFKKEIESPITEGGKATLKTEKRTVSYKGFLIEYDHYFYEDQSTGEKFTTTEMDEFHMKSWIDAFNKKYPRIP